MFRMPVFVWNELITMFLILLAFPVLTSGLALLWIDRHLGGHFYDANHGGQPILWLNLFWFFGHPRCTSWRRHSSGLLRKCWQPCRRSPSSATRA